MNIQNYHYSEKFNWKNFIQTAEIIRFYGLMYFIKDLENRGKLYLRIEVSDNLYFDLE